MLVILSQQNFDNRPWLDVCRYCLTHEAKFENIDVQSTWIQNWEAESDGGHEMLQL